MGIFPIFMNVIQFWLIDSIVKASTSSTAVRSNSDSQDREPLFNSPDDDDDDDDDSPLDIERGPGSSTSRTTSEGDFKTLVGAEDNMPKLLASGSTSPKTLPGTPISVAHDYPPNNVGSVSLRSSTRPRHKYRRSASSILDLPMIYSAPAVGTFDPTRNSTRQALLSRSLDNTSVILGNVAEFDAWEKNDEGQFEQNSIHVGTR